MTLNIARIWLSKNSVLQRVFSVVGEMWDQWDNFDIFASLGKLADTFKVR